MSDIRLFANSNETLFVSSIDLFVRRFSSHSPNYFHRFICVSGRFCSVFDSNFIARIKKKNKIVDVFHMCFSHRRHALAFFQFRARKDDKLHEKYFERRPKQRKATAKQMNVRQISSRKKIVAVALHLNLNRKNEQQIKNKTSDDCFAHNF